MKQFKTILGFELAGFFKSKAFVGITLAFVLILGVVMFFPRIQSVIGDDEIIDGSESGDEKPIMYVYADDEATASAYALSFSAAFIDYDVRLFSNEIDELKNEIISESAECAFVIESPTKYYYYVNTLSITDENYIIANEVMLNMYRLNAMSENGISPEDASEILSTPIESENVSLSIDQTQNFFYAYIMIYALYIVILLYGQMVTTKVATEKSSRAMELLITSAKPQSMMFAKVFASCIAGLTQLIAIFGSALVFYRINREYWAELEMMDMFFDIPPVLLVYMLVFFVLGFLIYAFVFGALGSTVSKLEEVNTAITPVMLVFVFMFMVVMISMGSGNVDTMLMKVCSYIPFTSPMAMFTRIALSDVAVHEIIISISILFVSVFGVGYIASKMYRVGVLLYGTPPKLGAIIKAMKKA